MDIGELTGVISIQDQLSGKLTVMASRVSQFVEKFEGAFGAAAIAAGVVTAAVIGTAISIQRLGEKGSVILGVEQAFDRLAEAAGSTGKALIGGLNEGVKGTIDSMKLMQSTTRLLSSGIKLNADDMKTMGAAARAMGKATGTDAASGLQTLSNALLTGRTRALSMAGIVVNLKDAEEKFAKSLGISRSELSETGKLEARRIGILDATRAHVDRLGVSELSFKERIQQAHVALGNWTDSLAKSVASSPNVMRALDAISEAMRKTFGGDGQRMLDVIIGGVNRFADAVTRFGPPIIATIGSIKNAIAEVWKWLSDLNTRFHITDMLVVGVQAAWSFLQKAFLLVRDAVNAVIRAWATMPDWLQRITARTVELGVGLTVASLALNAVATPVASLISKLDLGVNIIGNATGAIYAITNLTWLWMLPVTAMVGAYDKLTIALHGSTIAMGVSNVATRATTYAKAALTTVVGLTTGALTALSARLGLTTVAEYLSAAASGVLAGVKTLLSGVIAALIINYNVFIARVGLSSLALRTSAVATGVLTTAMTGLGVALLAVQYVLIPLVIAWASWKLGEWLGTFPLVQRAMIWLTERLGLISEGAAAAKRSLLDLNRVMEEAKPRTGYFSIDPELRSLEENFYKIGVAAGKTGRDLDTFIDSAIAKVHELKDNGSIAVATLAAQLHAFSSTDVSALKRLATEAKQLQESGAKLTPELMTLVDRFKEIKEADPSFILNTVGDAADALVKTFREAGQEATIFNAAFRQLSAAQRANHDVQALLVPKIEALVSANKTLSPAMRDVYTQYQATRQALLAQGQATLEAKSISLAYIESQKALGVSEAAIAIQYGVSTEALQKYSVAMQAFQTLVDAVTEAERKRAEEAFQNSTEVANTYSESYKKASDAVTEFQARIDTLKQTGPQQRDGAMQLEIVGLGAPAAGVESMHAAAVARIQEFYTLLRVDTQALTTQSQANLQTVADAAERTYQAALSNAQEYGAGAIKAFRDSAQAARDAVSDINADWQALRASSIESLQAVADRARTTYEIARASSGEFTDEAIQNFKRIAEVAQEALGDKWAKRQKELWKDLTSTLKQSMNQLSGLTVGNLGSLLFGFGSDASGELKRAAQEAKQVYLEIQRRGRSTAEELTLAFQRWREAEDRANNTFGERFGQLWRNMKSVFVSILDSMLEYFTKRFLVGVIEGIAGAKLGQKLGAALGSGGGSGGVGGGLSNVASNISLGQRVAGWFGLGGGGAAAGSGAGMFAGTTLAGGAASLPIAPAVAGISAGTGAGGGAGAAGLGGMSLSTGLWTAGIGTAAALLYWGIKNKGLFRGGAEHFINKRRDQFQLQLGGPPVSKGGSVMAAKLASWGSGFLFDTMQRARKKNQYDTAQSAIVASFAAHGQQLKSYERGGFTPPHTTELALLHGGQRGEAHIPGGMLGSTVNQYITIEGGVLDAGTVTKIFREHLIRLLKEALKLNTSGLREATAEVVG